MADLTIKTNNVPRHTLTWFDLTEKERAEFDYLDTEERQQEATFARYKGWVYDLGEFMRCEKDSPFWPTWDGYHGDSFFSGVLVKWDQCGESVLLATYFS